MYQLMVAVLLAIAIAIFTSSEVVGEEPPNHPQLLIVHQNATLVSDTLQAKTQSHAGADVRSGTALVGIRRGDFGKPKRTWWRVTTLEEPCRTGWIPSGAVTPYTTRARELKAKAISLAHPSRGVKASMRFPELILAQENPAVQQAWRDVADAISENEKLPKKEQMPEPYFARAQIWASVGNYSDSLQDYLTAIKYARAANRDLLTFSEYFEKLYDAAENLQNLPVPAAGAMSASSAAARQHYGAGYSKFFSKDFREALFNFEDSVRLAPDQPLYWYFRALTHRRLGDRQRAQHDALMGAYFERQLTLGRRRSLNRSLTRIQGESRTWLERYRLGSLNHRVLQNYNVRLTVAEHAH